MSAVPKPFLPEISISQLVQDALAQSQGSRELAASIMRDRLRRDPRLLDALIAPLLDAAIDRSLHTEIHRARTACERLVGNDDPRGLVAIANNERSRWLDYPMSTGMKLGDATKTHLAGEADMHAKLARGNMAKVKFFRTIAEKIGKRCVRDVMSDNQIAAVWRKFKC